MSKTQPIRSTTQLNQFKKYYQEIIPEKRNYALIILGLNTALRISDILQLRVSDVWDLQKQSFKRHLEVMESKTGKQTSIYINKEVRQALLQCLLNQRAADEFIFASYKYKNMPLSRYQAYRIVKQAAVMQGCRSISAVTPCGRHLLSCMEAKCTSCNADGYLQSFLLPDHQTVSWN